MMDQYKIRSERSRAAGENHLFGVTLHRFLAYADVAGLG